MKPFLMVTGTVFGLIVVAHIWRVAAEGSQLLNPWFVALTLLAAALCVWAFRLVRRLPKG